MGGTNQHLYRHIEASLVQVTAAVQRQERVELTEVIHLAGIVVDAIHENDQLVVEALSSPAGHPLVTNLVNVGILSTKIGIGLGYYGEELRRLALAGLVHDIGIFAVPQQLLTKTGRLTSDERAQVEQHPRLGSGVIERLGADYAWLAEVVLQAHERGMGQGYPNRLKGREINELAQIIGLVDIFDALVSPRPYRRRLLPHEAVRELINTERTAFPRELMKALVEQLSVYPLGTKVRVSSGEEGVVVGITPRYPSRPVIRVVGEQEAPGTDAPRCLDLSRLPQVSVVETIEPPALERVTFSSPSLRVMPPGSSVDTSSHFAALLESLDAIASVIQNAVDKSPSSTVPTQVLSTAECAEEATPVRREILGLFALEAREWLNQIQTALERLDATNEQPRRARLATILWQGMSNLARSASTVGLTEVEETATTLLPLLQAAGKDERIVAAHHVASLRDGLLRIAKMMRRFESADRGQGEAVGAEASGPIRQGESPSPSGAEAGPILECVQHGTGSGLLPSTPILDALRQLHVARGRSFQPMRDELETVIRRSEREMERSGEAVDARVVGRILKDLDDLDEQFLAQMQAHIPILTTTLADIRRTSGGRTFSSQALESIFEAIDRLYDVADRVSASNITLFLQGLHTFLRVTAQHQPTVVRERLIAVEERLMALVRLAQQWVEIGRMERAAIFEILPLA
jgi:hypothetical protein